MDQPTWARELAEQLLAEFLPRRWAHTQGVAERVRTLESILGGDTDWVEAAAWLHDIGYSPTLVDTGFHPLDGARYLRTHMNAHDLICRLVAHHSCAIAEAEERHLDATLLSEFREPPTEYSDALTYCDMTTAPDGAPTTLDDRLTEITTRYGEHHEVTRSIRHASPRLTEAYQRVDARLSSRAKHVGGSEGCHDPGPRVDPHAM